MNKLIGDINTGGDWAYSIFLSIIIIALGFSYANRSKNPLVKKYFKWALLLKLVGAYAFSLYHIYIYGGGDTFGYGTTGIDIGKLLFQDPVKYFSLIFQSTETLSDKVFPTVNFRWPDSVMWVSASNYFVVRFAAVFAPFGFNGYLPIAILFSISSFIFIWRCFLIFCEIFPGSEKLVAISFLFFPTVIFWGSGLGKDSLMLGSLCGFTTAAFNVFIFNRSYLKNILLMALFGYWLYICKSYILFGYFGPLAFAVFFHRVSSIKNAFAKAILHFLSFAIIGVVGFYAIQLFIEEFIQETAFLAVSVQAMQEAGSKYDLGVDLESLSGIGDVVRYFPIAIFTAWFRPFPWEARNIAMALSALESLFVTYLFVRILLTGFIFKTLRIIRKSPIIFANLTFAALFCALVTLSTGNFGTLVRYKLPAMPYLILSLLVINKIQTQKKTTRSISVKAVNSQAAHI